ncbi:MAG: hypothetical protein OHK0052_20030 [Anaerolineales bacterium]
MSTGAIFIDTSGWGNLIDRNQPYHSRASFIYRSVREKQNRIVTTNYVLLELVALLISPLRMPHQTMVNFIDNIRRSPFIEIVQIDAAIEARGWQLLKQHNDKTWSLVDCVSFIVMDARKIVQALTGDHHFEQARFTALLR